MSVKYTVEPRQRDMAAALWLILVIVIGGLIVTVAYLQRNVDYQYQVNETASSFIKTEVFEKLNYHIITMIIIIILVISAWGLGRKPEEIVPTPGQQES